LHLHSCFARVRSNEPGHTALTANRCQLEPPGHASRLSISSADACGHCPSLCGAGLRLGCEHDRTVLADMRACVLDRSKSSPIAQLKSTPGFGNVRRCSSFNCSVSPAVKPSDRNHRSLKEILNVALIERSRVCPSAFPSSVATSCLNPIRHC